MIKRILETNNQWASLSLRVPLGVIFIAHGAQKLFGWFGGYGLEGTGTFMASQGLEPGYLMALLAGSAEFFGGIALILGSLVRPAAADGVTANVEVTLHDDERVELKVTCSHEGYVRLADPFDKGWSASVDGEATEILIADHYLRAVYVEAGEHDIVFRYDGARVVWPWRLTLLAWLTVIVCFVTGRNRHKPDTSRGDA